MQCHTCFLVHYDCVLRSFGSRFLASGPTCQLVNFGHKRLVQLQSHTMKANWKSPVVAEAVLFVCLFVCLLACLVGWLVGCLFVCLFVCCLFSVVSWWCC